MVPVNDFAGCDGNITADQEVIAPYRGLASGGPRDILHPVLETLDEISSTGFGDPLDNLWV